MRYYKIVITDPAGKVVKTFTSFLGAVSDPGALDIELDLPIYPFAQPAGPAWVRVWGISLQDISQASDLNPNVPAKTSHSIQVYGGFQKGLPLANPSQANLLVGGIIQQAFGNWVGTDMTLDMIITAGPGISAVGPANLVVNWVKGTLLSQAIDATLRTAFPSYSRTINVDPKLVLNYDQVGFYGTLSQLGSWLKQATAPIIGGTYQGVELSIRNGAFYVYDGTSKTAPLAINFNDLIGQPTWIEPGVIQFNCPMRGDLNIGDYVTMPRTLVTITPQSLSQYRDKSVFQGTFRLKSVRHVGHFRGESGMDWISTFNAYPE